MTKDDIRIATAKESIAASFRSCESSLERLEAAIAASDGVPVRAMSEDDSMAVEVEEAKREHQETITRTERSRRAHVPARTSG